jgi:hypothetical protein
MTMSKKTLSVPTIREQLEDYRRFNAWERAAQRTTLQALSMTESLAQFFELCALASVLAPEHEARFLEERGAHWQAMYNRQRRLAEWRQSGTTTRRVA